jgi:hypothetical protein
MEKRCKDCGEVKPLDAGFYKHSAMSDGHLNSCKECVKSGVRKRRRDDEKYREYDRKRAKLPHRKARARAITTKWREENPAAYKAQTAVGNALRDGKLKRLPCQECGATKHVHAHHDDYSRPLDVGWLCAKCHHRLHATGPEAEGKNKRLLDDMKDLEPAA